jgi:hypothetical protein
MQRFPVCIPGLCLLFGGNLPGAPDTPNFANEKREIKPLSPKPTF